MLITAIALTVFIGILLFIAVIVSWQKQRMRRDSRTLDAKIFRRADREEEE